MLQLLYQRTPDNCRKPRNKKINKDNKSSYANKGQNDKYSMKYYNCGIPGYLAKDYRKPKKDNTPKPQVNTME